MERFLYYFFKEQDSKIKKSFCLNGRKIHTYMLISAKSNTRRINQKLMKMVTYKKEVKKG